MTRRVWLLLSIVTAAMFGVGVWAVGVWRGAAGWVADAINGRNR